MQLFIPILIDLLIVITAILIARHSMKIGAARTLIQIAGVIIAIVLISTTANTFSELIYDSFVKEKVTNKISVSVQKSSSDYKTAVKDSLPDFVVRSADFVGVDIEKEISGSNADNAKKIAENVERSVFFPVIKPTIKFLLIIVLIIISIILIKLLSKLTTVINKIPILGTANKGLGFLFGILKAFIILTIVCSAVFYITKNFNVPIDKKVFEKTLIFKYLCDINFLF